MMSSELETQVLHFHHQLGWPPGTIATQLDIHRSAVIRVLEKDHVEPRNIERSKPTDEFIPMVQKKLTEFPKLSSYRLFDIARERGYQGGSSTFRRMVAKHRPVKTSKEAFLRLKVVCGEEAQVDWGHFGSFPFGDSTKKLNAFVMVLSYSRAVFLKFYPSQHTSFFLQGHQSAFEFFGGCPKCVLYDNLKSVVIERRAGTAIRLSSGILEFSAAYRYLPKPVGIRRGNEKGRVERTIRYIRHNFFYGRKFDNLEDLNEKARQWCIGEAQERDWPDDKAITVKKAFEKEKSILFGLPENPPHCKEKKFVKAGKTPFIRFDCNDYSIPHEHVGQRLEVLASLDSVQVLGENKLIAEHKRSFDKYKQIENPAHLADLREHKRLARKSSYVDRLSAMVSNSTELLELLAFRGQPLRTPVRLLNELLDAFGAKKLQSAIAEALESNTPHIQAIHHILDRENCELGESAALPIPIKENQQSRGIYVKQHELKDYDLLQNNVEENEESA